MINVYTGFNLCHPIDRRGGLKGRILGAMAAAVVATYIALFSPYNIDLQRCDVASARGRNLSARSTRRKIF